MKAARDVIFMGLAGWLLVGCDSKTPAPVEAKTYAAAADTPILRISAGDFWKYQVRVEIPAGVTGREAAAVDVTHSRVRTYLGRVPFVAGEPEAECFEVTTPGSATTREFVTIWDDRIELLGEMLMKSQESRPIVFPKPILFIRAGLRAGDTIEMPALTFEGSGMVAPRSCRVIGREEIDVPAGKFQAVRLLMGSIDGMIETRRLLWFSPGVGIVREERVRYAGGRIIVRETHVLADMGHKN
jgi:hypothetical protein